MGIDLPVPPKKAAFALSEGIGLGAAEREQTSGYMTWLFSVKLSFCWVCTEKNQYKLETVVPETTALGAALLAVYPVERVAWATWAELEELARRTYPCLAAPVACPVRFADRPQPDDETTLLDVLKALNDRYGWGLDEIAGWLRKQGY